MFKNIMSIALVLVATSFAAGACLKKCYIFDEAEAVRDGEVVCYAPYRQNSGGITWKNNFFGEGSDDLGTSLGEVACVIYEDACCSNFCTNLPRVAMLEADGCSDDGYTSKVILYDCQAIEP